MPLLLPLLKIRLRDFFVEANCVYLFALLVDRVVEEYLQGFQNVLVREVPIAAYDV